MKSKIFAIVLVATTLLGVMAPVASAEQFPTVITDEDDIKIFEGAPPEVACEFILGEAIEITTWIKNGSVINEALTFFKQQLWRWGQLYDMIGCGDLKHDVAKATASI